MRLLDGRVAIVTGGSRGIGRAIACALLDAGSKVVVASTSAETIAETARELGSNALAIAMDVSSETDVVRLIDTTVTTFGGLDILVNNAGVGVFESVERTSLAAWRRVMDTNLTGVFLCSRFALAPMRSRGGGWIINVSSLASTAPFADGAAYCASKAGLNAFTESLMQEVRQDGIRVAAVLPGSVRTGFMGRSSAPAHAPQADDSWKLSPEDVAQGVMGLLAHPSRSLPSRIEIRPARPPKRG